MDTDDPVMVNLLWAAQAAAGLSDAMVIGACGGDEHRLMRARTEFLAELDRPEYSPYQDQLNEILAALNSASTALMASRGHAFLDRIEVTAAPTSTDLYVVHSVGWRYHRAMTVAAPPHCRDELTWTSGEPQLRVRVDRVLVYLDQHRCVAYGHPVWPRYDAREALSRYGFVLQEDPSVPRPARKTAAKRAAAKRFW